MEKDKNRIQNNIQNSIHQNSILVIGSLNMDLTAGVDHIPAVGETILSNSFATIPGGKGANQACAVGRLAGSCAFIGAIGNDGYGKVLQESLQNFQVDTRGLTTKSHEASGMAVVMVNKEGNNSIVVIPGANAALTPEDIDRHRSLIEECGLLVMQLEIPLETVLHAAKLAKSMNRTVILDPAPVPVRFPEELYQYIDIMKPNETELAQLTGISAEGTGYVQGAEFLRKKGVKNVLVTLGEKEPTWIPGRREKRLSRPARQMRWIPRQQAMPLLRRWPPGWRREILFQKRPGLHPWFPLLWLPEKERSHRFQLWRRCALACNIFINS